MVILDKMALFDLKFTKRGQKMLPFLKPKKMASVVMSARTADGKEVLKGPEDEASPENLKLAQDLISAVHAKDAEAVAAIISKLQEMDEAEDAEEREE